MKHPVELNTEASTNRDLARRARRLARRRSVARDRDRLERFAAELDDRAGELEAEAEALRPITPSAPVLTQQQVQPQQQASQTPHDPLASDKPPAGAVSQRPPAGDKPD